MKKMMIFLVSMFTVFLLAACGGNNAPPDVSGMSAQEAAEAAVEFSGAILTEITVHENRGRFEGGFNLVNINLETRERGTHEWERRTMYEQSIDILRVLQGHEYIDEVRISFVNPRWGTFNVVNLTFSADTLNGIDFDNINPRSDELHQAADSYMLNINYRDLY